MATLNFPDSPSTGDVYKDGNSGFSYEWNGTVWISTDPSTASNIREIDDISSGFDGSDTTFTLQVSGVNVEPVNVQQLIISVGGVMQNAGDDYTVSGSTLTFTTAPTSGLTFFGTLLGTALSLNTVADGTVGTSSFEQPLTIGTAADSTTIPGNAVVSGILTAANAYVTGILTAQTLNYNNVVDIYSTGIITATKGIQQTGNEGLHVSAGITTVGIFTATKAVIGLGVTANNTGIDVGIGAGIVTANSVKGMGANFSGGTVYSGKIVGTAATVGGGVTINNTGIDAGIGAGIVTAASFVGDLTGDLTGAVSGTTGSFSSDLDIAGDMRHIGDVNTKIGFPADDTINFQTAGSERLRIESGGGVVIGDGATYAASGNLHVVGDSNSNGPEVYLQVNNNNTTDNIGALIWGNNTDKTILKIQGNSHTSNTTGDLSFHTSSAGTMAERLRITSTGAFNFDNGALVERVKITAGKLSDNTSIDLINGMVYYFTTTETTTLAPNIRIDSSNTLNDAMAVGDVIAVTLVTTAAAAGYINELNIDGSAKTVEWAGAEAPSAGGDGGLDVWAFTIIKTAANTYKVLGNYTNFD